jgi:hypothetical protein
MNAPRLFGIWLVAAGISSGGEPVTIDFNALASGPVPAELMAVEGEFRIVGDAGKRVLEMQPEPVVEGALLLGPSLKGAASIAARVKADKSRRAFPRVGLGLHGISGLKLRLVPAQKKIELFAGEEELASVGLEWTGNGWMRLELMIIEMAGKWTVEGRVWPDDGKRPEQPTLRAALKEGPGQGRGSVLGSPYSNKPIQFDDVVVTDRS